MRRPASIFERANLIVECLPFTAEDVRACDDYVDFVGARFHRAPNFRHAFLEGRKTGWESRGDRGNMNAAALDGAPGGFDKGVINAHGSDLDIETLDAKLLLEFVLNRLPRLRAQAANTLVCVVAGECRQIHARDGSQEPSRLPFLLYRSPGADSLRAALDSTGVHAHHVHPIQIQRDAAVGLEVAPCVIGDGGIGRRNRDSRCLALQAGGVVDPQVVAQSHGIFQCLQRSNRETSILAL